MLGFVSQVSTESKAIKLEPVYKRLALTVRLKQFGLGARSPRDSGQCDTPPHTHTQCQRRVMRGWGQGNQEARPALPLFLSLTLGCPKVYNL